ncbi:hypothetical protein EV182_005434 [Spiromyces aspiralis]|uniref:Uncharacterized protein n=1 Tax=Spiromyces aspiralis TaxID=68401 RepID=A0ACC1HCA1_9FUNG|nr:hypothetical protein EV182_005434 [Spiromyces aspiralis]
MQQSDPHPAGRDAAAALLTPKSADGCIVASSDASVLPYYRANSGLHAKLVRSSTERAVQQQPPPRQQSSPTAPATKYARPAARPTHRGHTRSLTPGASTTTIISRLQATRSIQQLGGDHRSSKLANLVKLNNLGHSLYKPRQFIPDSSDIDEEDGGDRGSPGLGEDEGPALASHSQSIIMRHQYLGLALVRSISALPAETTTTSNSGGGGGNSSGASGQQSAAGNASEGTNQAPMAGCSLSYSSPPDVAVTTTALATPGDDCYSDYFYYQRFRLSTRSSHRLRQDAAVAADNKDERVGGDEGICEHYYIIIISDGNSNSRSSSSGNSSNYCNGHFQLASIKGLYNPLPFWLN